MTRICAYCKNYMGQKEPFEDNEFTHGVCNDCLKIEIEKIEIKISEIKKRVGHNEKNTDVGGSKAGTKNVLPEK